MLGPIIRHEVITVFFLEAGFLDLMLFGWFTAEIGRQPSIVSGPLRTADAHSPLAVDAINFGSYCLAKLRR